MGVEPETFLKGADSERLTDAYHDSAFQVFFDADDRVEYVELSSDRAFGVLFADARVFSTPARALVQLLEQHAPYDPDEWELGYTYTFPRLELALWRPDKSQRNFSTVGVGRPGYFSER